MDRYEKIGYACLAVVAIAYVGFMLYGAIEVFPAGVLILVALLGVGVLLVKVIKERLSSREDHYYSKNVEK